MKVTVLGAGSWGTALAAQLARAGHDVRLWARAPDVAQRVNVERTNPGYLPGVVLPAGIVAHSALGAAVDGAESVWAAVPSEFARQACAPLAGRLPAQVPVVSCAKGLELDTLARMTQVLSALLPGQPLAVLSGPSFALEVAHEQPTAVVIAAADQALAEHLQQAISTRSFRAYASDDVVGVELAGALKNVIAIAAGIVDGLGFGANTAAALITRGLAEISRLAGAAGGRPDTLAGLAGLGDLVLTCTGALSRNRRLGQALGRGQSLDEARAMAQQVAEGVRTTLAACALGARAGIELPIAEQMRAVLYEAKAPRAAVLELMSRRLKRE